MFVPIFDIFGELRMQQAVFNAVREQDNHLFCKSYQNDSGVFSFHSQIELYFVDEGEMEVWINDKYKVLKGGEMSVALSYDAHAYRTPKASRSSVLIIPTYLCEEFISEVRGLKSTSPFICDKETVAQIKYYYEKIKDKGINRIQRVGYIYTILGMVMDRIFLENGDDGGDATVSAKILLYINKNFMSGLTPADVAAHFGYTLSYLSRYFKSCFHITMNRYITSVKLKHALMLLRENRHSITYCALESGFTSMRTFYRAFYKEFGLSPKEYMRANPAE